MTGLELIFNNGQTEIGVVRPDDRTQINVQSQTKIKDKNLYQK